MSRRTHCLGAVAALIVAIPMAAQEPAKQAAPRPEVEVVFCLDTTGSMGGLINAAKQKIWSICNQIAIGKPTPKLKVGLVAYRDRGDAYITKVFDLTDDLDTVYANLMAFQAQAGGDGPESVNQALHESVTKIAWNKDKKTLKIIFLVGDAPPHMDYADDVKYADTCQQAVKNDIIINSIQCGANAEAKKHWQEICRLAEGAYVQIDAKGGPVVTIATPFDKDLAAINLELTKTTLVFGTAEQQSNGMRIIDIQSKLKDGKAADRVAFYSNAMRGASYDLLENIRNNTVKLEDLKEEQLPKELQGKTLAQKKEYLEKIEKQRNELAEKARDLDKQRRAFIAQKEAENAKNRVPDSFDNQVLRLLQTQAQRVNIQYENPVPLPKDDKKK